MSQVVVHGVDDAAHLLLQLGCSAYCARVVAEQLHLLEPHKQPLDFASGEGLALHAALGVAAWSVWSVGVAAGGALLDHYAEWRWSASAVAVASWEAAPPDSSVIGRLRRVGRRLWRT